MLRPDAPLLGRLTRLMTDQGASAVKVIPSSEVVFDERVRLKCLIPRCDSFGWNLMCPPHLPPVAEVRAALARCSHAVLVQVSAPSTRQPAGKPDGEVAAAAKKLHELINQGEKLALEQGFPLAVGLIGGPCRLCEECVGARSGEKCRVPFRARPSMEAMGIDVITTLKRAGLSADFPVSDRVTWTGCLLI